MRYIPSLLLALGAICLAGCDSGPKGSAGFTLPDGDAERGKAAFVEFQCNTCHVTKQVAQLEQSVASKISITLGGETTQIKTYGELVTSIINPSHRVVRPDDAGMANEKGESKMISFNDVMTVTQMVDLVAFVQSNYELSPYTHSNYPVYWIPDPSEKK